MEMVVGIYGQFGTNTTMAMSNQRPLSVIYVDGHSASLRTTGSPDSQFVVLAGEVRAEPDYDSTYDESARAAA